MKRPITSTNCAPAISWLAANYLDPVARHHEAIAMFYLGRYQAPSGDVTINTLNNVVLELSAARERVTSNIPGK